MPPGIRGENMSQGRGTPNHRDAERGAGTSGGAGVSTEIFSPRRDRDSEGQRRSSQGRREARGRRRREAGRQCGGEQPLERRSPREQRAGRRDHSSVAQRTSGGSKAQKPGEGERGSVRPFEPTAGGQDGVERRGPSPRRGKLRRAIPHERARHETRPWRSWQKQSAEGAKEPRGRNGSGEANPVVVGCRDRKR